MLRSPRNLNDKFQDEYFEQHKDTVSYLKQQCVVISGASVKNPAAFVVLQDVFLKCSVEQTSLLMMDVINVVFKYVRILLLKLYLSPCRF